MSRDEMYPGSGDHPDGEARAPRLERRPYSSPSLVTYGDLKQITQNVSMSGAMDGGANNSRTGP